MKPLLLLSTILAIAQSTIAGDTLGIVQNFRITDYKPVGFTTQSLTVSPGCNFQQSNSKENGYYSGQSEYSDIRSALNSGANHAFRKQTQVTDLDISSNAYLSLSPFESNKNTSTDNLHTNFSQNNDSYIYGNFSNVSRFRKYIYNSLFMEYQFAPSLSVSPFMWNNKQETATISLVNNKNSFADSSRYSSTKSTRTSYLLNCSSNIIAGIGKGWIADFTGAAIALHITDCIIKVTGNKQYYSGSQMQDLSLTIDRLRRKRTFDYRVANIEAVDTLCQFLVSHKFVDTVTPRLTMELNDIWNYGFSQPRYAGKETKGSPIAAITYQKYRSNSIYSSFDSVGISDPSITTKNVLDWPKVFTVNNSYNFTSTIQQSYGAKISTGFSRPYGRYFELDGSAEVIGTMNYLYDSTWNNEEVEPQVFKGNYTNATGKVSFTLSWFPTLRTTITLNTSFTESASNRFISWTKTGNSFLKSTLMNKTLYFTDFNTGLYANYFISPQCSYYIWGNSSYRSGSSRESGLQTYGYSYGPWNTYYSFSSGFNYALF